MKNEEIVKANKKQRRSGRSGFYRGGKRRKKPKAEDKPAKKTAEAETEKA
ncbi:MAG: hypothetical protein L6V88_10535 [Anaerotruncus sp.]|nr:MAG: hypothetical protein L6V88_10535 [Anaerotruncus sp.]